MALLALDSNIFIAAWSGLEDHSSTAAKLLLSVDVGHDSAIYSTLIFAEVLAFPDRRKSNSLSVTDFFIQLSNAQACPVDTVIASLAGSLRVQYPALRMADSVHLATALNGKAAVFVTNDHRLANISNKLMATETLDTYRR